MLNIFFQFLVFHQNRLNTFSYLFVLLRLYSLDRTPVCAILRRVRMDLGVLFLFVLFSVFGEMAFLDEVQVAVGMQLWALREMTRVSPRPCARADVGWGAATATRRGFCGSCGLFIALVRRPETTEGNKHPKTTTDQSSAAGAHPRVCSGAFFQLNFNLEKLQGGSSGSAAAASDTVRSPQGQWGNVFWLLFS